MDRRKAIVEPFRMRPTGRQIAVASASAVILGVTVTAFGAGPPWPLVPLLVLLLVGIVGGDIASRWTDIAVMAAGGALGVVAAGAWQALQVELSGDTVWRSPLWQALDIEPAIAAGILLGAAGGATFLVGRRFAGWQRLLVSGATGLAIAAAWVAVVGGTSRPPIDGYLVVGSHTIVIVATAPVRGWTRVTDINESPTDVRITVTSQEWVRGLDTGDQARLELIVNVVDPLATRTVRDQLGLPIPELHSP